MSDLVFGVLSGSAWGLIAQVSFIVKAGGRWEINAFSVAYVGVGAVVGVLVTGALRRVNLAGWRRIALVSLASLIVATAAFGFVSSSAGVIAALLVGVYQPAFTIGPLLASVYWVWGLFATGLFVVLWPLSFVNHWALSCVRARQRGSISSTQSGTG